MFFRGLYGMARAEPMVWFVSYASHGLKTVHDKDFLNNGLINIKILGRSYVLLRLVRDGPSL